MTANGRRRNGLAKAVSGVELIQSAMKTTSRIMLMVFAMMMALLLTNCSMEGRVIDTQRLEAGNRHFIQERVVVSEHPYETRIVSRQVL